jgi:large subunit ribosomal protein L18
MKFVKLKYKRRMEGKTDYKARMFLLKSNLPRIVIRKTNRYIIAQVVESKEARDTIKMGITSKELVKSGWTGSFKNVPAAYATGLILGKKAIENGIKKAILDEGIIRSTKGSRVYAFVKGAIDSGLDIPHNAKIFPDESRISGDHIKNSEQIKKIINKLKGK